MRNDLTADVPFAGRVAIVTGAGSGIGRAEALQLALQGAKLVVNDLGVARPDSAASVVAEIHAFGGIAVANTDTVATMEGGAAIVRAALDAFGRLDILINNAGVGRKARITEMSEAEWDIVTTVHLKGSFNTVRHAAPIFRAQGSGIIINTSSDAGLGTHSFASYAAAKEGIVGFTRALAWELGRHGIRCNAIRPRSFPIPAAGNTSPNKHALFREFEQRFGHPMVGSHPIAHTIFPTADEVGAIVAWLCTDEANPLNGRTLQVGGGEVGLWSEPEVVRSCFRREGWDFESLKGIGDYLCQGVRDEIAALPDEAWALLDNRPDVTSRKGK